MKSWKLILCGLMYLIIVNFQYVDGKKYSPLELNENNWKDMLQGEWMIEFFSPTCPACQSMTSSWDRFGKLANDQGVKVARIDVTKSPGLGGRFFVSALPTIYHVKNGDFRIYEGGRDHDSFVKFIKQSQWAESKPMGFWRKPSAYHMSMLSVFFNVSRSLKSLNSFIQSNYDLPAWCSFTLIGSGTLLIGGIIGLLIVIALDFVYPEKKTLRRATQALPMQIEPMIESELPRTLSTAMREMDKASIPLIADSKIRFRSVSGKTGDEDAISIVPSYLEDEDVAGSSKDQDIKQGIDTTSTYLDTQEMRKRRLGKSQPISPAKKLAH